jgi:hypothetical protein
MTHIFRCLPTPGPDWELEKVILSRAFSPGYQNIALHGGCAAVAFRQALKVYSTGIFGQADKL